MFKVKCNNRLREVVARALEEPRPLLSNIQLEHTHASSVLTLVVAFAILLESVSCITCFPAWIHFSVLSLSTQWTVSPISPSATPA